MAERALRSLPLCSLALVCAAAFVSLCPAQWSAPLTLEREAVLAGEWWRIVSGHLWHGSPALAAFDLAALALLGACVERRSRAELLAGLALAALLAGGAVVVLRPDLDSYQGSSALASALLVSEALHLGLRGRHAALRWAGALALAGLATKIVLEGANLWPSPALGAGGALESVAVAHLAGAVAGAAVRLGFDLRGRGAALALAAGLTGCGGLVPGSTPEPRGVDAIDDARLRDAASETESWLTYGRDYAEQRFSPLARIHEGNVAGLGLAFFFDTSTTRGLEATPLVVDGVIYTTGSWSVVYAVDARTGRELWRHDPQVPRRWGGLVCCDVVNRGVALYRGRVYLGTLDGRLQALDAKTGAVVWSVVTVDQTKPYSITMAPRIVKGQVIVGNGGAELGVRGYVSAYDAGTGSLRWRFYTVPGDPSQPLEHPALAAAAKTWTGEWWKVGGGGTVWDALAFDPALDLLYVGTGNGSPWSRYVRSPGGGDNLYVSSILALRPDTGELVWHYQTTPGDNWDFTSTQHLLLADLEIGGRERKVLMQAPKNGFFYVLDRATGELLSADPYVTVTWATGVDLATGRPLEADGLDYREKMVEVKPSPFGGHNWQPMSWSPKTGLVYLPAQEVPYFFRLDKEWRHRTGAWNTGADPTVADAFPRDLVSGHLLAWDPVARREVWRAQYTLPWNGGTLATAGNLVFQGTAHGTFAAYRATDGKLLFEAPAGTGIVAPPVTYELDGEQYVAVMAGWGGAFALVAGDAAAAAGVADNRGRLLVWKLGGTAQLPPQQVAARELAALPAKFDAALVTRGNHTFHRWCATCHGVGAVSGGVLPDLRKSDPRIYDTLDEIALAGALANNGMPRFDAWLHREDIAAIRAYLLTRRAALIAEKE